MSRSDKDSMKRQEQEKLQSILNEILKEEDNKYCADCEAKGPRWASWNLGVFLCIRCAGIHRNLGVHISRVKSVNLDTWTVEQVQSVRVLGNSLAKALYEANLPSGFRRPQTDSSLEAFIRAKYEHKRYVDKDLAAPKVDPRDLMIELENLTNRRKLLNADPANATNASGNIQLPPKTSPGSKRKEKEKKDGGGRKPSGGGQKSVSSTNCSDTSNLNDLVDLSLDLGGDSTNLSSQAPKGTVDDLLGLADLHSHIQQPIRNHSSPFLPSFNTEVVSTVDSSNLTQKPANLSPLAGVAADASSAGGFADFTAVTANSPQQQVPLGVDGSSSSADGNLFSLAGAGTANDKKSKNDILALYSSGGGTNVATTPSIPTVPFMPTGAVTSGYFTPYPAVPTQMNYAYPTTVNPVQPVVYGGVPSGLPGIFGAPQQTPPQPIAPAFGYSNVVPPQMATPFVQQQQPPVPSFAVGGVMPPQMAYGSHGNAGQQQAAQLQHVREQLAALQIQRAQQPSAPQQSSVVTNTLATNLWQ